MSNKYKIDRNNALFSLNENKIRAFFQKYNIQVLGNQEVFWGAVYKSVLAISECPAPVKKQAEDWLDMHGFQRTIGAINTHSRYPRHTFEHVIFPCEFYKWSEKILSNIMEENRLYLAYLYKNNVEAASQTFNPSLFRVISRNYGSGNRESKIVRLDLPKPNLITECRRIYLCLNEKSKAVMYFTSELSMLGTYYLCAWTKNHTHMLLDMEQESNEFDHVAELFNEYAGYEPPAPVAV